MTNDVQRKAMAEKLWLLYFNQYLYEQGASTETERNQMKLQIEYRKPLPASH